MRRLLAAGLLAAATLTPPSSTDAGGGWRTFANCFAHAAPGGRPKCEVRATNRDPSPRLRYIISSPDITGRVLVTQTIRCFYRGDDTTTARVRVLDLTDNQFVYAFRPYLVDTPGGDRRARYCSVRVSAEPERGDGELSVFMEAAA